ncbi:MAG: hypothetical protein Q4A28_09695 [Brachymonas sp.]|nr:hypothetical protein [Brachymonas sp.]
MNTNNLQELALRLSAFTDALEQRATRMHESMERSGQAMAQSAQGIDGQVRSLSQNVIAAVRDESRHAVEAGAREGVAPVIEQLQQSIRSIQTSSETLRVQSQTLHSKQRSMVWLSGLALLVGSLLAAGGSAYFVWKNQQELKRGEFGRDILDATRTGAINRCGEALCVRVGSTPQYYDKNREYVLLK